MILPGVGENEVSEYLVCKGQKDQPLKMQKNLFLRSFRECLVLKGEMLSGS